MNAAKLAALAALGGDISELVKEVERLEQLLVAERTRAYVPTTQAQSPLRLGNKVFIRTVTNYHVGQIVGLTDDEVILTDAAWIADTARFHDALKSGIFKEIEPFIGIVSVGRGAIIDVTDWPHKLPLVQK